MPADLIGVDVGGTFTDVIALDGRRVVTAKVPTNLTTSPASVLEGSRQVGVGQAKVFNLATTAGLNAVITRRIPKVAFLTTLGHRDMLDKGRIWRPYEALTDPGWRREFSDASRPLVPRYLRRGVEERMRSDGLALVPLNEDQVRNELGVLRECEVEGVAICLLHSWMNGAHERRLKELVGEVLGDVVCSISSDVSPLAREYPRASTTVIDVIMKVTYRDYTAALETGLKDLGFAHEFNYADCAATLMPFRYAMGHPHKLVVGGPASGAVAAAHFGTFIDEPNLLCADVGGTSCDISLVAEGRPWMNGTVDLEWDLVVNSLSVEIVTLGAGGGSIVSVGNSGEIRVGPESAGADPGPACYGHGGMAPTLTDAGVLIGVLSPAAFLGGEMSLDEAAARRAFEQLPSSLSLGERIRSAWMIGIHNIAEGILDVTIRRGIDPRDFSLLAFGAAGPMLLPMLLDLLPMKSVIVPPYPGHFSAAGLLSSDRMFSETRTSYRMLDADAAPHIAQLFAEMEGSLAALAGEEISQARIVRTFDARLMGQGWETPFIPVSDGVIGGGSIAEMLTAFHDEYQRRNGNRFDAMPVEAVTFRVQLILPTDKISYPELSSAPADRVAVPGTGKQLLRHLYGHDVDANCFERDALLAGDAIEGPAIIREPTSTTLVPVGRTATVGRHHELVIA